VVLQDDIQPIKLNVLQQPIQRFSFIEKQEGMDDALKTTFTHFIIFMNCIALNYKNFYMV